MSRLIDADALREQLVWCKEQAGRYNDYWDDVIERLDSLPTVSGWISVKDSLPEPDTDVLWCAWYAPERVNPPVIRYTDEKWDIRIDRFTGCVNHGIPQTESYGEACIPLYWMPLPEPPKEETPDA
jgi:hypothetical protein